jgi:GT2 family glycosyltransferase
MKLSIVIINWNSRDLLAKCLDSICGQEFVGPLEIIVVDGGSFDGADAMVREQFPEVQFIQSPENIGYGRCCNLGACGARGEYLMILNPDTELRPGAIHTMIGTLAGMPNAGLVGARLIDPDGAFQTSSTHPLPGPFNTLFDCAMIRKAVWRLSGRSGRRSPFPVQAVSGACMLVRMSLYRKLGGFNPRFFMYGEDVDLCQRVRDSGYGVYHVPAARVVHHGGMSSAQQVSGFSSVMIREAVDVIMRIHRGEFAALCGRVLMSLSALLRLVTASVLRLFCARGNRARLDAVIAKWMLVLRWCCGGEKWASHHFATTPRRVICNACNGA